MPRVARLVRWPDRLTVAALARVSPYSVAGWQVDELLAADEGERFPGGEFLCARPGLCRGDQDSLGDAFVRHRAVKVADGGGGTALRYRLTWLTSVPPRMGSEVAGAVQLPHQGS